MSVHVGVPPNGVPEKSAWILCVTAPEDGTRPSLNVFRISGGMAPVARTVLFMRYTGTAVMAAVIIGLGAVPAEASQIVCIRAGDCPAMIHVRFITATAEAVHGTDGLLAAGWRCRHVTGRVWTCTRRRHFAAS